MQERFTPEIFTIEPITQKEEETLVERLPDVKQPSENLVNRLLNYSRSLEVKKTKSVGVITTTLC